MARYRTANALQPEEAAYIAGLIDGEGTITLSRLHRDEMRRLVVSISNNELSMLRYVQETAGVGHITRKRTYSVRHAPSFTYQVSSRQALDLLRQVVPYLRSYKSRRAHLALERYLVLTPRNGKYRENVRQERSEFEARLLAMRP